MTCRLSRSMRQIHTIILSFFLGFIFISSAAPLVAHADAFGLEDTRKETPFAQSKTTNLPQLVGMLISAGLSLIGVIFLALAVYGGFVWMTARGDTKLVQEGRDTLVNATIGILLIVGAYAMTNFLFEQVLSQV